jgi:hypothetical protein
MTESTNRHDVPGLVGTEASGDDYAAASRIVADGADRWRSENRRLARHIVGPDYDRNEPIGTTVGHRHVAD